jgi:hypothetical protein
MTAFAPRHYPGVMVSSTFDDFVAHRDALMRVIAGQGLHPVAMEQDSARPAGTVIDSSLEKVRDATAYVGLIGQRGQMFAARVNLMDQAVATGRWEDAEKLWRSIDSMGRNWSRNIHRPGDAELTYMDFQYRLGRLKEIQLDAVEVLVIRAASARPRIGSASQCDWRARPLRPRPAVRHGWRSRRSTSDRTPPHATSPRGCQRTPVRLGPGVVVGRGGQAGHRTVSTATQDGHLMCLTGYGSTAYVLRTQQERSLTVSSRQESRCAELSPWRR